MFAQAHEESQTRTNLSIKSAQCCVLQMMLRGVCRALLPQRRGLATIVHVRHTAEAGASPFLNHVEIENHSLVADEPASVGGQDLGPAPYDLVLAGLGQCANQPVRRMATSRRWRGRAATI